MKVIKAAAAWMSGTPSSSSSRSSSFASSSGTMVSNSDGSCITSVVTPPRPENQEPARIPDHHCNDQKTLFKNPWSSFNSEAMATWYAIKYLGHDWEKVKTPEDVDEQLPVQKPNWTFDAANAGKLKATWLSHASFLLELPAPPNASRGARILFDPVFSEHCATQAGALLSRGKTKRHTAPPCQATDLKGVDLVLISHNHYDHMDLSTLSPLQRQTDPPYIMVPLNNERYLEEISCRGNKVKSHSLDWWQSRVVQVDLPSQDPERVTIPMLFEVTCVPSQHQSNRGPFDRNEGLWAGYTVTSVTKESRDALRSSEPNLSTLLDQQQQPFSCFFAGDTAYAYSSDNKVGTDHCPAFKQIGQRFGGFDLAFLPIGAYIPREFTSSVHASPADSVQIFQDVQARRALAMHWGTFTLTNEELLQPRQELIEACKEGEISDGAFTTCNLGETVVVECFTDSRP